MTERFPVIGHLYMIVLIPLTWSIFAITDLSQLGVFLLRLFPFLPQEAEVIDPTDYLTYAGEYGWYLLACLVFCTRLPARAYHRVKENPAVSLLLAAAFGVSVYCLCMGLNDPFLYFRF